MKYLRKSQSFVIGYSLIFLILFACKHEHIHPIEHDHNNHMAEDFSSAIQLKVGNYWIYDFVRVDSLGNQKRFGRRDSVWIDRDSVVRKRTYYRRMGFHPRYEWLYDSASCIVSLPDGTGIPRQVFFSGTNYKDTLYTITQYYAMMHDAGKVVNTYLGKFSTSNMVITPKNVSHKQDPTHTLCASQSFYAKNIGMVYYIDNHFGTPSYRSLIKYKIN